MTIFSDLKSINQASLKAGRLLAIDIGTKRLGIAISDATRLIANPRAIIKRQSNLKDFAKIKEIIEQNQIVGIVVGIPINMEDQPVPMTEFAKNFSKNLDEFLNKNFPIFFADERLTSFEARQITSSALYQKHKDLSESEDDIAASLILQDFLENLKSHSK